MSKKQQKEEKQRQKYSTPEGLEPSLPMGNALAVRRLNRSAKVSFVEKGVKLLIYSMLLGQEKHEHEPNHETQE